VLFLVLVAWLLPKIWRALKRVARAIGNFFAGGKSPDRGSGGQSRGSTRRDVLRALYHDARGGPDSR